MNMSGDLKHIEFHGDTLYATTINDKVHVVLRPAFESIGIDADRQIANLKDQPWATTAVTAVVAADGNGEFELPVIPDGDSFRVNGNVVASQLGFRKASEMVRTLADDEKELIVGDVNPQVNSWAQTRAQSDQGVWYIAEPGFYKVVGQRNVNLIKDRKIRDAVARFQHWVFHDVIPAMVRSGQADERCLAGTTWSWDDVAAEIRQRYGLDYKPSEITAGMRAAGWLKAGSCVPKHEHRWKFWHTGIAYHLLPHALPELVTALIPTMQKLGDRQANQYQLNITPALKALPADALAVES